MRVQRQKKLLELTSPQLDHAGVLLVVVALFEREIGWHTTWHSPLQLVAQLLKLLVAAKNTIHDDAPRFTSISQTQCTRRVPSRAFVCSKSPPTPSRRSKCTCRRARPTARRSSGARARAAPARRRRRQRRRVRVECARCRQLGLHRLGRVSLADGPTRSLAARCSTTENGATRASVAKLPCCAITIGDTHQQRAPPWRDSQRQRETTKQRQRRTWSRRMHAARRAPYIWCCRQRRANETVLTSSLGFQVGEHARRLGAFFNATKRPTAHFINGGSIATSVTTSRRFNAQSNQFQAILVRLRTLARVPIIRRGMRAILLGVHTLQIDEKSVTGRHDNDVTVVDVAENVVGGVNPLESALRAIAQRSANRRARAAPHKHMSSNAMPTGAVAIASTTPLRSTASPTNDTTPTPPNFAYESTSSCRVSAQSFVYRLNATCIVLPSLSLTNARTTIDRFVTPRTCSNEMLT
jgi:hypothetical protein